MQWGNWSYKPINHIGDPDPDPAAEVDEKDPEQQALNRRSPRTTPAAAAASIVPLAVTATAVLFIFLFVFTPRPWLKADHPDQVRHYGCGNSTQDAAAAGCKFDVMSYTWVHPRCFDQELMYDFLGSSQWTWYGDEDAAQPLALNEVAQGQHEYVFVTWEYYTTHCTYSESL